MNLSQSFNKWVFSRGQKACWKKSPQSSPVTCVEKSEEHFDLGTAGIITKNLKIRMRNRDWCNGKSTGKGLKTYHQPTNQKNPITKLAACFAISLHSTVAQLGQSAWLFKVLQGRRYPECTEETRTHILKRHTQSSNWPSSFCDTDLNRDSVLLGPLFHDADNVFYLRIASALQKMQYFP